jgi:hypothetical protein
MPICVNRSDACFRLFIPPVAAAHPMLVARYSAAAHAHTVAVKRLLNLTLTLSSNPSCGGARCWQLVSHTWWCLPMPMCRSAAEHWWQADCRIILLCAGTVAVLAGPPPLPWWLLTSLLIWSCRAHSIIICRS